MFAAQKQRIPLGTLFVLVVISIIFQQAHAAEECIPAGSALLPTYQKTIPLSELPRNYANSRTFLLGEHHDNAEHHRWQLQMVTALHIKKQDIRLGLEMFPRKAQPILDQWVAGELTEQEFLKAVNWAEYWRFDPDLYMPIFHYARMNKIPMHALNVERSLIQQVGKLGWDNVSEDIKEGVSKAAKASRGYQELLANVFMQHGSKHGDGDSTEDIENIIAQPGFQRFVESQSVWDRAMAEVIAEVKKDHPDSTMISIVGSGHMMYFFGIPEQLTALGVERPTVLIPWDPEFECEYIRQGFADAVIGLKAHKRSSETAQKSHPLLGIFLEATEAGARVMRVVEGSVAEGLGIQEGDIITQIASRDVDNVNVIIDTVKTTPFGAWLPLTILRDQKSIEMVAKFPLPKQVTNNEH